MMEEVAVPVAYDSQTPLSSPVSEDEVLACLVVETGPKAKGPVKRAKLKDGVVQSQEENEDPIDKYQRENKQLLRASLRLEQENDSLAHRLVTSKIALRTSLDEAEDTVDDLMEQLRQTKHRLRTTEEEMRGRQQEAEQVKEGFKRDLESADQGVKKSARILVDYKQICSQLTLRLEVQQATNTEEMEALKGVLEACPGCRLLLEPVDESSRGGGGGGGDDDDDDDDDDDVAAATGLGPEGAEQYALHSRRAERQRAEQRTRREKEALELQVRALERELAQSKLQVVEANCSIQELEHQNSLLSSDLQAARNSWFTKAFVQRRASSGGLSRDSAPLAGWRAKRLAWLPKESPGGDV
ncbi:unnamed protein product [Boreogadus saida]